MWAAYFGTMAVLGLVYIGLRCAFMELKQLPPPPFESGNFTGHTLDARPVSDRLKNVREELQEGKAPLREAPFKHALRVESARKRIARLPCFEEQPATKASEQDDGLCFTVI